MPLVIFTVFVQLANKRGFKEKKITLAAYNDTVHREHTAVIPKQQSNSRI
jgi:hypothetical protein